MVSQLIIEAGTKYPHQGIWQNNEFTPYPLVLSRVLKLSNSLHRMGIGPNSVVGVLDANSLRFLELHYALAATGAIMHPLNFRLSLNDLEYTIRKAQDTWLIVGPEFSSLADTLKSLIPRQIFMPTQYENLIAQGDEKFPDVQLKESDPFSIGFTTGTTGRPRAVVYRHRDVLLSSWQVVHHLAIHDSSARLKPEDTMLCLIPFAHAHGWGIPFMAPYIGASLVLSQNLSPHDQVETIIRNHVTWANMVPTQLYRLLEALPGPLDDTLKVLVGGSALTHGLAKKALSFGLKLAAVYGGADQLASAISTVPLQSDLLPSDNEILLTQRLMALPGVEIEIRDDSSLPLSPSSAHAGEIWVKSPWIPTEYLHDPTSTEKSFRDGWFATGDLGIGSEDGTILVVDRLQEAIKSGGEWIAVNLLETILSEIDGIDQVSILAKSDPKWGERPVAVVQTRHFVEPEIITAYLTRQVESGRIPKFWIPDHIFYIKEMPLTSAGKIHKQNLAAKLDMLSRDPRD